MYIQDETLCENGLEGGLVVCVVCVKREIYISVLKDKTLYEYGLGGVSGHVCVCMYKREIYVYIQDETLYEYGLEGVLVVIGLLVLGLIGWLVFKYCCQNSPDPYGDT